MRTLLLLTALGLTACTPPLQSGELAVGSAAGGEDDATEPAAPPPPNDPLDPVVALDGVDFGSSPSLWYTQHDDGGWMLMISQHPDYCAAFQTKTSFDDGDLCNDAAGHPTTLYIYGIPNGGGDVSAADLWVRLVEQDPSGGCTWPPRSFDGGLSVLGSGASARGSFEFAVGDASVEGAFSAPRECPGIPDWG